MIKILPLFLFALVLCGCKESRTAESDKELPKARFVSYVENAEKYPVSTKPRRFPCEECAVGEFKMVRPSFYAELESFDIETDSVEMPICWGDILLGAFSYELSMRTTLGDIYAEHIRKMRKSDSDSSYFTGILDLKIPIDTMGRVGRILVKKSTTENRPFDDAVLDYISSLGFSQMPYSCFLVAKLRFERSGFSGKTIEIVDERLIHFSPLFIPGGCSPMDPDAVM